MNLKPSSDPFPDDPMKICEAAALVRISRRTLSRRMQQGRLRVWRDRFGRSLRVSRAEVLALWESRAPGGARPKRPSAARQAQREETLRQVRERLGLPVEG